VTDSARREAQRLADAVAYSLRTRGYPPTVRELGHALGLASTSTVQRRLEQAREAGLVTWTPGVARTLRVVEP
jgi:repressor LexA